MRSAAGGREGLAAIRATLLDLLAERDDRPAGQLGPAAWETLDQLAAEHRLRPLLHHRRGHDDAIPPEFRSRWRDAYRHSALASLQFAAELRRACELLGGAGFEPIALKGAWLAWHAYPHPALRPMRDLDLLLPASQASGAFELLRSHGYRATDEQPLPPEHLLALDKHMPPLLSPGGVFIELHQHLWETEGKMDHSAPSADEAAIRSRAFVQDGMRYIHPQDLLAHLIIHAVYDHRLDCGPLVLSDIAALLRAHEVDWARFWQDAEQGRWLRGAVLVLALVRNHAPGLAIALPPRADPLPPDLHMIAAGLLLQNLATRQIAGVMATLGAGGLGALGLRLLARRREPGQGSTARDLSREGGFASWAASRLARTARELARADVRTQSRELTSLSRWLDG